MLCCSKGGSIWQVSSLVENELERRSSSGVAAGPRLTKEAALATVLHCSHRPADAATVFISYAREDEK